MQFPKIKKELFFSVEEYEQRLARFRAEMVQAGIEVMLVTVAENVYYLSGYQTLAFQGYQALVVPLEGKPYFVVRYMESMLVAHLSWIDEVETWDDTEDPASVTVDTLRARSLAEKVVGIEEAGQFLSVSMWKALSTGLPKLRNGTGLAERCRACKSPQEIAYMRKAARLTDIGLEAAVEEARAGVTENDVGAAIFDAMTRAGSDYLCLDPIVTSGPRSGVPHTTYYRRALEPGDTLLLEFSGVFHRYHAPRMRGVAIGPVSPLVERMANVCIEALDAAIASIRPGVTGGEVDAAARRIIEREGLWENYRKRAGYSVGCGFATWTEGLILSLHSTDRTPLEPGMCVHLPMALRYYGEAGLGFSETVLVTETGAEPLGSFPRRLVVR